MLFLFTFFVSFAFYCYVSISFFRDECACFQVWGCAMRHTSPYSFLHLPSEIFSCYIHIVDNAHTTNDVRSIVTIH
jgi:hypothetical protein